VAGYRPPVGPRFASLGRPPRPSACRLRRARHPARLRRNDLYENLTWLCQHQEQIERRLFAARRSRRKPELFLYDVTSSYLEGEDNALGAYGYNRDGKKGKKQIVIGLLCDEEGTPVSTEVFRGNTQDPQTFGAQVSKASERFGCQRVTFVGDRGVIKSGQIEELSKAGFHYITAITKPQIETLLAGGVLQMALFDDSLCEVEHEGLRYVLRRNPVRAEEIAATRTGKQASVAVLVQQRNQYLAEHAKAQVSAAEKKVRAKVARLKAAAWLRVESAGRSLQLVTDERHGRKQRAWMAATRSKRTCRRRPLPSRLCMTDTKI